MLAWLTRLLPAVLLLGLVAAPTPAAPAEVTPAPPPAANPGRATAPAAACKPAGSVNRTGFSKT